jgi:hypothetical protein
MTDHADRDPQQTGTGINDIHNDPTAAARPQAEDPTDVSAVRRVIHAISRSTTSETPLQVDTTMIDPQTTPWILRQFFNGEVDLDEELSQRFENMPVMSTIKIREMGEKSRRSVATMSAQDGAAQVILDVDRRSRSMQMTFTFGSMLTLRFGLYDLSHMDHQRWLNLMRRDQGGLAFLWGPSRWEKDYVICVSRRYFTNFYAFSPYGFESAVRMTPKVTQGLLEWLEEYWQPEDDSEGESPLLTW